MKLELRGVFSSDVNEVWTWEPEDPGKVFYWLQMEIGWHGEAGGDLFQAAIATPLGLAAMPSSGAVLSDRALLVLSRYSWPAVQNALEDVLKRCQQETWVNSVACLQRYFLWEYEDYRGRTAAIEQSGG